MISVKALSSNCDTKTLPVLLEQPIEVNCRKQKRRSFQTALPAAQGFMDNPVQFQCPPRFSNDSARSTTAQVVSTYRPRATVNKERLIFGFSVMIILRIDVIFPDASTLVSHAGIIHSCYFMSIFIYIIFYIHSNQELPCLARYHLSGRRFSSGIAIETTKPESRMALVTEQTRIVSMPLMKYVNMIRKPNR